MVVTSTNRMILRLHQHHHTHQRSATAVDSGYYDEWHYESKGGSDGGDGSSETLFIVVAVVVAGICVAAVCMRNWRERTSGPAQAEADRQGRIVRLRGHEAAPRPPRAATHGADDEEQGEVVPQWYRQGWDRAASVLTAAAEDVVPVGLPVAASEDVVTVVANGSWAPASGGSWVPASGGGDDPGAGIVVVTGRVLPNV